MVLLAHSTRSFASHPMHANMAELAGTILIKMLLRMLRVFKIVSLANLRSIRGILAVPLLRSHAFLFVLVILLVARTATKRVGITLICRFEACVLCTRGKDICQVQNTLTVFVPA